MASWNGRTDAQPLTHAHAWLDRPPETPPCGGLAQIIRILLVVLPWLTYSL